MLDERPPTEDEVRKALDAFAAAVRERYGMRLKGLMLFGSRARGDHRPDSDADVAVILEDGEWSFWREKMALADLTYEALVSVGLRIQAYPIVAGDWEGPQKHRSERFVRAMKRDARALTVVS